MALCPARSINVSRITRVKTTCKRPNDAGSPGCLGKHFNRQGLRASRCVSRRSQFAITPDHHPCTCSSAHSSEMLRAAAHLCAVDEGQGISSILVWTGLVLSRCLRCRHHVRLPTVQPACCSSAQQEARTVAAAQQSQPARDKAADALHTAKQACRTCGHCESSRWVALRMHCILACLVPQSARHCSLGLDPRSCQTIKLVQASLTPKCRQRRD